jgi:hypothetical protein
MHLSRVVCAIGSYPLSAQVVRGGVERAPTRIALVYRRHIRSPCCRYTTGQQISHSVGMVGLEPTRSCSQGTWACRYPTSRCFAFLRSVARMGVEPGTAVLRGRSGLKDQYPEPIDERAVCCRARTVGAHVERVGREALESSSAAFQATAKPSQLPTRNRFVPVPG